MPSTNPVGSYGGYPIYSVDSEFLNCSRNGLSPAVFSGKANSFVCPLGDKPGYGYVLMMRDHINTVLGDTSAYSGYRYDLEIGIDNTVNAQVQYLTLLGLVYLRATRIYPGVEDDSECLMLVELADKRYWLQKTFIDTQYNVRYVDDSATDLYLKPSLKYDALATGTIGCDPGCRLWTWREILEDIWAYLPAALAGTMPTLPSQYDDLWDSEPEQIKFNCMSALTAFCEALKQAGGGLLGYDPTDDTFRIVFPGGLNPDTSFTTLKTTARSALLTKREVVSIDESFVPDKIRVVFLAEYDGRENEEFFLHPFYNVEVSFSDYLTTRSLTGYTSQANAVEIINQKLDARIPYFNPQGCDCPPAPVETSPQNWDLIPDPTNLSTLTDSAKEIAYRFWDQRIADEPLELIYEGCLAFRPGTKVLQVSWYSTGGTNWLTRVEFHRALANTFDRERDCCRPIASNRFVLVQYTGTGSALGPRDSGGVAWEGDGYVVDYLITGATAPDTPVTVTLSGRYAKGLTFPNEYAWARFAHGKYWIIGGSQTFFGSTAEDWADGSGLATVHDVDLECVEACSETLVEGTVVYLNLDPNPGGDLIISAIRACCSPIGA